MEIIVDANIILAVILNEPDNVQIIESTKGVDFVAPDVLPYEIGNALSSALKKHKITENEVLQAFQLFKIVPVRLVKVNILHALVLSNRFKSYAYDAYYLEVAQRLNLPLITFDEAMKTNAKVLNLKIWEI
jgi:predicted nucleic acid-binding protein